MTDDLIHTLQNFEYYLKESHTLKKYKWDVNKKTEFVELDNRIYEIHLFDSDGHIQVFVRDIETDIMSISGMPDIADKRIIGDKEKKILETAYYLAESTKHKIIQEAKEQYLKDYKS